MSSGARATGASFLVWQFTSQKKQTIRAAANSPVDRGKHRAPAELQKEINADSYSICCLSFVLKTLFTDVSHVYVFDRQLFSNERLNFAGAIGGTGRSPHP